jgi:hypothetical protein
LCASSMANRLGASAVTNIELVMQVVANATHIRYAPMRRGARSGRQSYSSGILLTIGKMVPALRAVFEGVNGASRTSDAAIAYPSPRVLPPSRRTRISAMRRPSPVSSYPIAKTNAPKMSQTVLLLNPDRDHFSASVGKLKAGSASCAGEKTNPNAPPIVTAIKPIDAIGNGSVMSARIAATNSAR